VVRSEQAYALGQVEHGMEVQAALAWRAAAADVTAGAAHAVSGALAGALLLLDMPIWALGRDVCA
jgi:hypothetical protein